MTDDRDANGRQAVTGCREVRAHTRQLNFAGRAGVDELILRAIRIRIKEDLVPLNEATVTAGIGFRSLPEPSLRNIPPFQRESPGVQQSCILPVS